MKTSILMLLAVTLFFLSSVDNEANSAFGPHKACLHNNVSFALIAPYENCEAYHQTEKHGGINPEDCVLTEVIVGDVN